MKLWAALYVAIWVVFLDFLLAMIPQGHPLLTYLHAGLGFVIVGVTYYNFVGLKATTVPGRVKRIAWASFYLSVLVVILGLLLLFNVGASWTLFDGITVWNGIIFVHVVTAFAVITQMAATAIAYDMWEEKEFAQETRPGEVPPAPVPVR